MGADNVIPIRSGGDQPPAPPVRTRKSRRKKPGLQFADDANGTAFRAFMGLKGVCHALYAMDGDAENLDDFVRLSAAADLLVDLLARPIHERGHLGVDGGG